jgi:hypothetical protein
MIAPGVMNLPGWFFFFLEPSSFLSTTKTACSILYKQKTSAGKKLHWFYFLEQNIRAEARKQQHPTCGQ